MKCLQLRAKSRLADNWRTASKQASDKCTYYWYRLTSSAWIQNTTLRDNVLFGREWNEHRYWKAIQDACLLPDLEILPDGDLTEVSSPLTPGANKQIGEKGL